MPDQTEEQRIAELLEQMAASSPAWDDLLDDQAQITDINELLGELNAS